MHTVLVRALLIHCLLLPQAAWAIVNIDQSAIGTHQDGISHIAHLSLDGAQGNSVKTTIKGDLLSQWQHQQHSEFLLLQYAYGKSNGKVDTNRSFVHLRHRTQLNPTWAIEAFAQTERDTFARLANRTLLGGGLRFTVVEIEHKSAIYTGLGAFYEREQLINNNTINSNSTSLGRANAYLILRHQFNPQLRLSNTTYYQPALKNSRDYRLLEEAAAQLRIDEHMNLKLSLEYNYDARPPQGVKTNNLLYSTGLEVKF